MHTLAYVHYFQMMGQFKLSNQSVYELRVCIIHTHQFIAYVRTCDFVSSIIVMDSPFFASHANNDIVNYFSSLIADLTPYLQI